MAESDEVARMLADIRSEVHYTRGYIQREQFAETVMMAMAAVPRHAFVPDELRRHAYDNGPLPIGHGQTISQPYIVALMSDLLNVGAEDTVLEIGTGSGYQTAVLSQMVKQVYSVERIEALSRAAESRLRTLGYTNISMRIGDGHQGWPEHAPYDGIIVTAGAQQVPEALVEQLKPGARLVIPVSDGFMGQQLLIVEKTAAGECTQQPILPVAFVPLVRGQEASP